MKKILTLLLFTFSISYAQDLQKLDDEYGFRGNKFGAPVATFKNMLFITGTGEVKVFSNRDEDLKFGEVTAQKITYEFYKTKFYKYNVTIKGIDNRKGFLAWFQSQYGKGTFGGTSANKYAWVGKKVVAHYHETPTGAIVEVSSMEFEDRIDKDKDKVQE